MPTTIARPAAERSTAPPRPPARPSLRHRRARRGATILYGYAFVMLGCALGTLAVDYGHMQVVKTQLQRCADVTARGSIENYLRNGLSSAQSSAAALAAGNPVDAGSGQSPTVQVTWGYWNGLTSTFVAGSGNPVACKVVTSRTAANGNAVPVLLPVFSAGPVASHPSCDVSATAIAVANTRLLFDYSAGFGGASPTAVPTLVGTTAISGSRLRVTTATNNQAGGAWSRAKVSVGCFTTSFSFQLTNATADGFCFVMQNQSATALGSTGGGIGYQGLTRSFCIKFDLYNNSGEGTNSTGLYTGGAAPTVPSIDLTSSGINLRNGHTYNVVVSYDGTTLIWTITDAANALFTATNSSTQNIPSIIGGSLAYVGFVGSTGGSYAQQDILTWTYSIAEPRMQQ